jgi:hypothetical protein
MLDNDQTQRPSAREIADDPTLPPACRSYTLRSVGSEQNEASCSSEIRPATPQLSSGSLELICDDRNFENE